MIGPAARLVKVLSTAAVVVGSLLGFVAVAEAQGTDSLTLRQPQNIKVWRTYSQSKRTFNVLLSWQDIADSLTTYIHPPDTLAWRAGSTGPLSLPSSRGVYSGDIDRTLLFRAEVGGVVGVDTVQITYEVIDEGNLNNVFVLDASYVPGTWLPLLFRDQDNDNQIVDLGIEVSFSDGGVDKNGVFRVGVEDFEGFHIWRGIQPDGGDLEVIGELSKEEADIGSETGGEILDSVYFDAVLPALRSTGTWFSPFGSVDCLGTRLDIPLAADEMFWFDCNVFNGFTYYYAVTTFDRDYLVSSGRQGLVKFDNCLVSVGIPFECPDELRSLTLEVDEPSNLTRIYAVPNPYRSGGSRITTENYHNFPDGQVRFVNVPPNTSLKVFTVSGELVWEHEHLDQSGNIEWDLTNRGGMEIGSGVYIYRAFASDGETVYGRLVVIR